MTSREKGVRKEMKGFTLIELLVVIAIIGLLSAVVLSSLNTARMRARDAQRKSDIVQIRNAMELYFLNNGYYPWEDAYDTSMGSGGTLPSGSNWTLTSGIYAGLVPTYIKKLPVDPINSGNYYYNYEPNSAAQGTCTSNVCEYSLNTRLESGAYYCVGTAKNLTGC